uniref:Elongation factor Ts, mitochondrial n=1 Tax=Ananas comosus var. bracteatus TaxID=296719 RepID=A0A6V7PGP3_ANACO|nr:unnamed protein product [Ananas comosus var. bracteatus]
MMPVIHYSVGNISLLHRSSYISRKEGQLKKCSVFAKHPRLRSSSQRFLFPQSSLNLIPMYNRSWSSKHLLRSQIITAVGTDVSVEEPNPSVSSETSDANSETATSSSEASEPTPTNPPVTSNKGKRPRPARKSEMPPVKDEELIPGAYFTGKVRSIQPFGLFVDFGAFSDGLVHVSRVSDGYVKDVSALFSVGQEVKVRIVEANKESGRISLTMRENDDGNKKKEAPATGEKTRPARKNSLRPNAKKGEAQKSSKFVKGQALSGAVKNLTRSGAFVSLPDGEEGFLPVSEESEGFGGILGNSSLQVGQEVNVRVLRIARGQVTLTMKQEEDVEGLNRKLNQGVVHMATNPFELAFRRNKEICAFLDEREEAQKSNEKVNTSENSENIKEQAETPATNLGTDDEVEEKEVDDELDQDQTSATDFISTYLVSKEEEIENSSPQISDSVLEEAAEGEKSSKTSIESTSESVSDEISLPEEVKGPSTVTNVVEAEIASSNSLVSEKEESSENETSESNGQNLISETVDKTIEPEVSSSVQDDEEVTEADLKFQTAAKDDESSTSSRADESKELSDSMEEKASDGANDTDNNIESSGEMGGENLSPKDVLPEDTATNQEDDNKIDGKEETEKPVVIVNEVKDEKSETSEISEKQNDAADQGSTTKVEAKNTATISPALVKQLREETGAGMMDCKKALAETDGDIVKAQEYLRKKGLASADKKASRVTAEGRIGSYVHDGRIGILIEVNCETDFVSRGEIFKQLVDDLAMQVAACPQVRYLATADVPEEIVSKEKEIEMQKEDLLSKPEQIRAKIVEGRIKKRLEEFALLEQPYIKNDKVVVKDMVKQTIATIGENIKVKRFVRYNLGEGLEKKSQDFAAEVAAQTAAKASPSVPKDNSAEAQETAEKPPATAVSAALVKQLREETGAGMMDCKKALTETGGDLVKAQEYLRKKGLSSADKKSSRLAAEGLISAYIHDSRIGCLIEVNCETDFVGRNEKFKELVDDLAMQVVACPQVEFVSIEDIPKDIVDKEREIEMQREDIQSKPENIREKIVEGRISKRLGELALLEQPFIKDDGVLVKDLVKQTVAALGENIKVRRFVRFTLGESEE